ncbi:MAG: DUF1549 domain-containing protein [Planctomycetaceae bacterium]
MRTPYDRFVTEQLAADQLGLGENDPALAGLGFLTVGMQFRNRHDVIDDQIDVVTRGLMGLTVACARCHDHKYDPIPTTDYYALYATLASSTEPDMLPIVGRPPDSEAYRQYQKELIQRQTIHRDMGARSDGSHAWTAANAGGAVFFVNSPKERRNRICQPPSCRIAPMICDRSC